MILERCKSKSHTALWENKFSAPNSPDMEKRRKSITPLKVTFATQLAFLQLSLATIVNCVHVFNSPATLWQNGGACTNLLMSIEIV